MPTSRTSRSSGPDQWRRLPLKRRRSCAAMACSRSRNPERTDVDSRLRAKGELAERAAISVNPTRFDWTMAALTGWAIGALTLSRWAASGGPEGPWQAMLGLALASTFTFLVATAIAGLR